MFITWTKFHTGGGQACSVTFMKTWERRRVMYPLILWLLGVPVVVIILLMLLRVI